LWSEIDKFLGDDVHHQPLTLQLSSNRHQP
jgi:hypothetical protein